MIDVLALESTQALLRTVGLAVLSAAMAAGVAVAYRWYARARVPPGVAVLVGLSAVAIVLNTTAALGQVIGGADDPLSLSTAAFNLAAFLVAGMAAPVGGRVGDRLAVDGFAFAGSRELDADVSQLVRAVGRVVTVELPDEVEDVEGYDPVAAAVKEQLSGKTLVFPRGLTVAELRERLADRLEQDYDVGHADVELAVDGTVEYLAVGRRRAGLGPTLAPGSAAVAITADPAFGARAGDRVQLWRTGERGGGDGESEAGEGPVDGPGERAGGDGSEAQRDGVGESRDDGTVGDDGTADEPVRVATAELRAAVGDTVTLAVDADDATELAGDEFRLVTLPAAASRPDRELAGLLRLAEETLAAITIRAGSTLDGASVGSLDATVVAVRPKGGRVEAVPSRERELAAGDAVFVVARPEVIRRVEGAAGATRATGAATEGDHDADSLAAESDDD